MLDPRRTDHDQRSALRLLRDYRGKLTRQQTATLAGQIKAGHPNEAMNGLAKLLNRKERNDGVQTNTAR